MVTDRYHTVQIDVDVEGAESLSHAIQFVERHMTDSYRDTNYDIRMDASVSGGYVVEEDNE